MAAFVDEFVRAGYLAVVFYYQGRAAVDFAYGTAGGESSCLVNRL